MISSLKNKILQYTRNKFTLQKYLRSTLDRLRNASIKSMKLTEQKEEVRIVTLLNESLEFAVFFLFAIIFIYLVYIFTRVRHQVQELIEDLRKIIIINANKYIRLPADLTKETQEYLYFISVTMLINKVSKQLIGPLYDDFIEAMTIAGFSGSERKWAINRIQEFISTTDIELEKEKSYAEQNRLGHKFMIVEVMIDKAPIKEISKTFINKIKSSRIQ